MPDKIADPRLSATVLMIRDATEMEVLMVARHYEIDFAAGALVFPGGKANEEDASEAWGDLVTGAAEGVHRTARIAAIREAFEESGLLLARHADARTEKDMLVGPEISARLGMHRAAIDTREMSFLDLIRDNGLVLALDRLLHFGHWITPEFMPKRFDTHFYLAAAPARQMASHDGHETTSAVWINPNKALEQACAGKVTIIFPTRMNLVRLGRSDTCDLALEAAAADPVVTVLPEIGKDAEGRPCLNIPAEAGYGQTQQLLDRVKV